MTEGVMTESVMEAVMMVEPRTESAKETQTHGRPRPQVVIGSIWIGPGRVSVPVRGVGPGHRGWLHAVAAGDHALRIGVIVVLLQSSSRVGAELLLRVATAIRVILLELGECLAL
jgi:hypothetical protein